MAKWTAIVLTCANKNSSIAYQNELKLKQDKGLIDKESLIICIEDPEKPIGSGGATLNALLVVAETLSARNKYRMTQFEILKNTYILVMHMGRSYPFDTVSKGFSTLPLQDKETNNLMTNFDLLYNMMTNQIACLNQNLSDPGIYICSSDMFFLLSETEKIEIKNKQICVLSSLSSGDIAQKNGIYDLDADGQTVRNINYQPDDKILSKVSSINGLFNLVSGIVYLNYEICKNLYNLLLFPPLDACSYIGIDSGASPLCLSIFFDILLACCDGISKEEYINGSFKTNHNVAANQAAVLKQARLTLWNNLNGFKIHNITVSENVKQIYMDNETFEHRKSILYNHDTLLKINNSFKKFEINNNNFKYLNCLFDNSKLISNYSNQNLFFNSVINSSELNFDKIIYMLNCEIENSKLFVEENSYLSDLKMRNEIIRIPASLFVQNMDINLDCLKTDANLNIVFGINDNLSKCFNNSDWLIMNKTWLEFNQFTQITESDLWSNEISKSKRNLFNAKLYPVVNSNLKQQEMSDLSKYFWLDLLNSKIQNKNLVNKWKQSLRFSLEDISSIINLENVFKKRRNLFNLVNINHLVNSVVENRPIKFNSLIKNAVHDGFSNQLLSLLDNVALKNSHDLILLPRLMVFISNTLCEMALNFSTVRSGPGLNINWMNAFQYIENGQIEQALYELSKERNNWLYRNDLLIRASRHYEGAMLAFIRQATSSFKSNSIETNRIILKEIDKSKEMSYEWVQASSPARLDLAGAWSDTPPITYECKGGSCVTNVAILVNNEKPIGAKGRILNEKINDSFYIKIVMQDSANIEDKTNQVTFLFNQIEDFRDYNKPQAVCCLMKAVLIYTKLIELNTDKLLNEQLKEKLNGSLELYTWTGLPQGSGLGTSSILIGCVLKVVWYLMGVDVSNETLSYSILIVEQLMTTNGGWQDQVGGIWGGFKLTTAKNRLPLEMNVNELNIKQEFIDIVNQRLVLIYTGLTRLAKDLLLNVLRNWYAISTEIYDNVDQLVKNGFRCAKALQNEDIKTFGECINKHRMQKLNMAPGSEPESVKNLIKLIEPYVHGMALAGAGGGGFLYAVTKEVNSKKKIQNIIDVNQLNMKIYDAKISLDGIEIKFF